MKFRVLLSLTVLAFSLCTLPAQYTEGISVREARDKAWTPEQSQKAIELDGAYEAQVVASEPLIFDPVEMTWDAKGRCFVADMVDYPMGPPEGQKPLSRIVQLLEPDKNGRYTKSKVFADHVDHVQGLLPYKDGLIATTRTQILFLRDTNGDGVADEIKPLVEGFNPNHSQLQVSAPRWGLDNCVYFNNGLNTGEIYPSANPEGKMKVARTNLRWDPATGKLELATGNGQFGGCFDDWGRHFFCSNRNPAMFAVMPHEAVVRNPHAGITQGWEDIAPTGAEAKVYPLQLSHTTSDAHAGTHTAACGLGVYRGDLMPELRGDIFVCEPTGQCVVRYHVEPNGASLKATRVGDHKEFFRSRDEWCRPVNVTTGPDGALYICDIYRQYIDHARFFPEAFVKSHDMRAGEHEGRIWRVVPKGAKQATRNDGTAVVMKKGATTGVSSLLVRAIEPAPSKVEDLVAWLGHPNAWQRETAQRLLVGMKDNLSVKCLKSYGFEIADKKAFQGPIPFDVIKPAILSDSIFARLHGERVFAAWVGSPWWTVYAPGKPEGTIDSDTAFGLHAKWLSEATTSTSGKDNLVVVRWFQDSHEALPLRVNAHGQYTILERSINDSRYGLLDRTLHYDGGPSPRGTPEDQIGIRSRLLNGEDEGSWILKAVLSASLQSSGRVLGRAFADNRVPTNYSSQWAENVRGLTVSSIANAYQDDASEVFKLLDRGKGKLLWWKPALLQGLSEGLPKSGGKFGVKSLAEFTSKPPADYKEAAAEITALLSQVDKVMTDAAAPLEQRLAVIPLLPQRKWEQAEPIIRALFADGQPPEINTAALAVLRKYSSDKTAPLLYELLPKAGPAERRDIVTMLSSGKTLLDFLQRMDRGEVPKSFIGAEQRWGLQRNANPQIKELSAKLFGTVSSDRAAVINAYMEAAKKKGDPQKGHQVFQTICITCHRIRGEGVEVGPDITDVRIKPVDALLTDILDPNRICEPRFMAYQVDTKDGRVVSGIVAAESGDSVTLKLAGGVTEAVPRGNIKAMKCLDQSLMPVGVEATISKEQMADLMSFLRGE